MPRNRRISNHRAVLGARARQDDADKGSGPAGAVCVFDRCAQPMILLSSVVSCTDRVAIEGA
ncbi:MAG: hypothetical protein AAF698_13055, partial [Pseudomonadota bacterium]